MLEAIVGTIGAAMLAVFGWAFQMNTKLGVLEKSHEDLKTLIETKLDNLGEKMDIRFDATGQRLDRIERSMNGHLKRD